MMNVTSAVSYTHLDVYKRQVKEIQERLAELGYFSGSIDGNFGNSTKEAVELFQEDNSLDVTGIVSNEELDLLFSEDVSPVSYTHLDVYKRQHI